MVGMRNFQKLPVLLAVLGAPLAAQQRAITVEDFLSLPVVADPQLSPDGHWVAYTVTTASLKENRGTTRIWLADAASGESRQLTRGPGSDWSPRWSPDGRSLAFLSSRQDAPQIYLLGMAGGGGEARQASEIADGVGEFQWQPDARGFLAVVDVQWPDNQEIERRNGAYPTEARLWTELFYRHWNEWRAGRRQHVFHIALDGGSATDLTPIDHDAPTIATGGAGDVAMSPDGKEIAVAMHGDAIVATNTNVDIFVTNPAGGAMRNLTEASKGADNTPRYSPDGKWLSYLSMERPGFEADRQRLMLMPRAGGATVEATAGWNVSIGAYEWCPDAKCIVAVVEQRGQVNLYRLEVPSFKRTLAASGGLNTSPSVGPRTLAYLHQSNTHPAEVWVNGKALTHHADPGIAQLDLHPLEEYGFVGAMGDSVFGWVLKPPGFDATRRYPLVYLVHGGPQGAWDDDWHARWNYQMFASRGYVVAAVNFHGSTGYGQGFTDAISQHWGDYPLEDLMKGLDAVTRLPYVDSTRMCAAGASYGGYMVYWIAGHSDRFKCLVDHDGVFNPVSMYGTTEELWFVTWEFGGTPYDNRALYEKWSPLNFVKNWKTPMLIVHSQHDDRVDMSEGYQAFTALRTMDIPAKFLYFPDEYHFVTKPRNRRVWWGVVLDWIDEYLKN